VLQSPSAEIVHTKADHSPTTAKRKRSKDHRTQTWERAAKSNDPFHSYLAGVGFVRGLLSAVRS